jgi:hypothetical protein
MTVATSVITETGSLVAIHDLNQVHELKTSDSLHCFSSDLESFCDEVEKGSLISDRIVNFALVLLKAQFPFVDGLQDTVLSATGGFDIGHSEGIQIFHVGMNHWVTASTIGGFPVKVADSLSRNRLHPDVVRLCKMVWKDDVKLVLLDVQQQVGSVDCGVFAIAFATAWLNNLRPTDLQLDQKQMRIHLVRCFRLTPPRITPFPWAFRII